MNKKSLQKKSLQGLLISKNPLQLCLKEPEGRTMLANEILSSQASNASKITDLSLFQRFLTQRKLDKLLEKVFSDSRKQDQVNYSSVSLLRSALSIFFSQRIKK